MSFAPGVDTEMLDMNSHDASAGDNIVTSWGASNNVTNSADMTMYSHSLGSVEKESGSIPLNKNPMKSTGGEKHATKLFSARGMKATASVNMMSATKGSLISAPGASIQKLSMVQQLEVAAGARISQQVCDDPNDLEFWQKEPEGLIIINYCTQSDALAILAAGKIDLSGHPDGFLQKVPKGNP